MIMQTFQTEQNVRTLVDGQLKNLGWNLQHGKKCNVFQEQPRTEEERRKLKGKRPDYVLYAGKEIHRKEPLAIIETKKPGANLGEALKQGDWYAKQLSAPIVFATDGIYYKTLHTKFHKPLYLNGEEVDELIRELQAIKFLENNEVDTISTKVKYSRQELIKIFEEANNLLRAEGLRAGIERFGEFSNILFLKLLGEIEDLKEEQGENSLVSKDFRWNHWKNKKGDELLRFVNDTVLNEMGRVYQDSNIFTPLSIKNSTILEKIIDKLEPLTLVNIDSDIKGDSFEYFLKQSTSTKNDLGEYFTPRHIVKTMVKLVNPQFGERIYDPFCGTGGMLIESFRHISKNSPINKRNRKILQEDTVFGNEITSTARITKMNMILIGDGHSGIQQKNSLKNPVENEYDIVITNMPYSQKTEFGSYYDLPSDKGDSICIQHCIKAIDSSSENGRMAVIVPEGFLFRKDMQKTRKYLLDRCCLKSIISLPQGVFLPYAGVKTNILYCTDIKKKKKQEKFWYFDVKNDGYSLNSHRKKLEGENDLQNFLAYRNTDVHEKRDVLNIGFSEISMDEVKKNDFILCGKRYRKIQDYGEVRWDIVELGDKRYFEIQSGGTPSSKVKKYWNGNINWATLEDLPPENFVTEIFETVRKITKDGLENSSAKLLPKDSILVSSRATIGRIAIARNEVATNQGFKNIVIKNPDVVNEKYLAFMIIKLRENMEFLASGGTFKEISKSNFEKLKIPLPPIEIQQVIVDELESYQNIIMHARGIIEEYKPNISFEENWESVALEELGSFQYGFTSTAREKGDVRFIRITDIDNNGELKEEGKKYIGLSEANKQYLLQKGDILVARTGATFGKTFLFMEDEPAIFASYLIRITLNKERIIPYFYWIFAQSEDYWTQANYLVGGTGQPQFNANVMKQITIKIPRIKKQKEIISKIKAELKIIRPNKDIIKMFENKIQERLNSFWGI